MNCYGKLYNQTKHCVNCKLKEYCAEAGDLPLINEYRKDFNENIQITVEADEILPDNRNYSISELVDVIDFIITLDDTTLFYLREKILNPNISLAEIAKKRNVTRQAVHKLLKHSAELRPQIAAIVFNRCHKGRNVLNNVKIAAAKAAKRRTPQGTV